MNEKEYLIWQYHTGKITYKELQDKLENLNEHNNE